MWVYLVRRIIWAAILLLIVSLITFLLGQFGPGDPIEVLLGQYQNPEVVARISAERGLDKSVPEQYYIYLKNALQGDFGESYQYQGRSVGELIPKRIWISAQLGIAATILSLFIGIPVGVYTALKQGTWLDPVVVSITVLFMSVPYSSPGLVCC